MTTLTIQLPDAHRDRLARSAPVRANWRSLAVAAIVVVASMAAEAAAAGDYYVRAGVGFDRPARTIFMDRDCSSSSPAALYGCGTGGDGAPFRSVGDFGTTHALELGLATLPRLRYDSRSWSNTGRASPSKGAPISWRRNAGNR